jgi:inosine-uridine nucleoside N-ribohydrolase
MCPEIVNKASIVWLGGHSYQFPDPREMNLNQDIPAAQVVFNSGIPLVQIPAGGVTDHLTTTIPELEYYLNGKNEIGTYLTKIVTAVKGGKYAASKVIWDIAGTAYFTVPTGMTRVIQHTPILTDEGYFVPNDKGEYMVYVKGIKRDPIFADVFTKISGKSKM